METSFGGRFEARVIARVATSFGVAEARQIVSCIIPIGQLNRTLWYGSKGLIESGDWFFGDARPIIWYA